MRKLNCWEFKKCGGHFGGEKVSDLGLCPAVTEISLDGAHGGDFGGRSCWVLERTICNGAIQGNFEKKKKECEKCDFYEYVKKQEGNNFLSVVTILKIIEDFHK